VFPAAVHGKVRALADGLQHVPRSLCHIDTSSTALHRPVATRPRLLILAEIRPAGSSRMVNDLPASKADVKTARRITPELSPGVTRDYASQDLVMGPHPIVGVIRQRDRALPMQPASCGGSLIKAMKKLRVPVHRSFERLGQHSVSLRSFRSRTEEYGPLSNK
jgi:hypothetical protein